MRLLQKAQILRQGPPRTGLLGLYRGDTVTVGGETKLIDRSGNGYHATIYGYCPLFDGSSDQYLSGVQIIGNEIIADHGGTAETLSISAGKITPSAGTVEWIEFTDGRKYIIQSSKTGGQDRFWNINGSYIDSIVIVGLTSPRCVAKSSIPLLLNGYSLEENIVGTFSPGHRSEPSSTEHLRADGNITCRDGSGVFSSFDGEIVFGDNSEYRYAYSSAINDSETLYFSFYVAMDDGLPPVPGYLNNPLHDFGVAIKGSSASGAVIDSISHVGSGVYLVIAHRSGDIGPSERVGISKGNGNTARTFKVTRYHAYKNQNAKYVKATYQSVAQPHNTGIFESFIPLDIRPTFAKKIVCIGDSLTATDYPLFLQVCLPYATVLDKGTGGDTASGMLARFEDDVIAENPDYIMYFGIVNGLDSGFDTNKDAIEGMIAKASSAGIPMVIGTGTPFGNSSYWTSGRQTTMEQLNSWILSIDNKILLSKIDLYTPLLDIGSEVNLVVSADSGDGLHLSEAGNTLVTRLFYESLGISSYLSNKGLLDTDLPIGVSCINAPAELELADIDDTWFTDSVANDVDPAVIQANTENKIIKGPRALLFYDPATSNPSLAERYAGL